MVWACNCTIAQNVIPVPNTKETGTWTKWMEKESAPTKTKATTSESSGMTKGMDKECTLGAMVVTMKVLGKMIEWREKEFFAILIKMNLLVPSKTTTSTKRANSSIPSSENLNTQNSLHTPERKEWLTTPSSTKTPSYSTEMTTQKISMSTFRHLTPIIGLALL